MPYQGLLDGLLSVEGAVGAFLLDAMGEVVLDAGARDDRHRLIGAYQGIALSQARRTADRYGAGEVRYLLCHYDWGSLILRPLKDGYYLLLSLAPDANIGRCLHRSAEVQERLNAEL